MLLGCVLFLITPQILTAQTYNFNYNLALSTPTFSTTEPVEMGFINVSNGICISRFPLLRFRSGAS